MKKMTKKAPHPVVGKAIAAQSSLGPKKTSSMVHSTKSLTKGKKMKSAHGHGHTSPVAL